MKLSDTDKKNILNKAIAIAEHAAQSHTPAAIAEVIEKSYNKIIEIAESI